MLSTLYYEPRKSSAYSSFKKLQNAAKIKKPSDIVTWLHKQDAYTLHRPIRKRFPRNPYSVNNVLDVFECDLLDIQALKEDNDGNKYLLPVVDVFSKFLHIIPLKSKTGKDVSSAFQSVLQDPKYSKPIKRRPVCVRTDKGKEFLNTTFQNLLKCEGIQFQVCKNPDIKCSLIEGAHRTVRDKLYKYFTYKNMYRYIDILSGFVEGYNASVHSSTGMPPVNVSDSDVLAIWKRKQKKHGRVRTKTASYRVGHVRISKGKAKFAKSDEKNFSTEIFRIIKVIRRTPRPVYELEDLNKKLIDVQFYEEELTSVNITKQTQFQTDKIIATWVRRGIKEHLVR